MRNSIVPDRDGNLRAHSRLWCRKEVLTEGQNRCIRHSYNLLFCVCGQHTCEMWTQKNPLFTGDVTLRKMFFHIPNAPATLPYFYALVHHYSIPVGSCHNILCLTVPVPFTLSTPCFPCPMLFDMHISWSHKWILLIQNTGPPQHALSCSVTSQERPEDWARPVCIRFSVALDACSLPPANFLTSLPGSTETRGTCHN